MSKLFKEEKDYYPKLEKIPSEFEAKLFSLSLERDAEKFQEIAQDIWKFKVDFSKEEMEFLHFKKIVSELNDILKQFLLVGWWALISSGVIALIYAVIWIFDDDPFKDYRLELAKARKGQAECMLRDERGPN